MSTAIANRHFRAILFDAYGTLLDVHSVALVAEQIFPGRGKQLSALWREKQLQYTWLRTLSGRYAAFRQVTGEALDYAGVALGLPVTQADQARLISAYDRLAPFSDVAPALDIVAGLKSSLAVLSNGTPQMLEAAFAAAGLRERFIALLSVDTARAYKPSPEAYRLALAHFGGAPHDFLLVSSNGWDVAGAGAFGFATFWVNRLGAPVERLGVTPSGIGTSLADLAPWLAAAHTPR